MISIAKHILAYTALSLFSLILILDIWVYVKHKNIDLVLALWRDNYKGDIKFLTKWQKTLLKLIQVMRSTIYVLIVITAIIIIFI